MKIQIVLFVVSCITIVLCAGQEDESKSPPSYKPQPWSRYQSKYRNQNIAPQTTQSYYAKRLISENCRSQEQCFGDNKLYLGSSCSDNNYNFDACPVYVQNSQCVQGHCACQKGFVEFDKVGCLPLVNLNEKCSISSQCHTAESKCNNEGLCVCRKGFVLKTDRHQSYCVPEKLPGEQCDHDEECTSKNSSCIDYVCQCNKEFVQVLSQCPPARHVGESCEVNKQCVDANSECKNSVCSCEHSSVPVKLPNRLIKCMPGKKLGEACSQHEQCQHKHQDAYCQNRRCECQQGLLNVANQLCLPANMEIGQPCFVSAQCSVPSNLQNRIGCYLEPHSSQSLCLVEGEALRSGYGYRYNHPAYTQQSYNRHDYQAPKYGNKEEENEDDDDQDNDNDQALPKQNTQSQKSSNKYKVHDSNNDEEYEDNNSYQASYLQSKVSAVTVTRSPMKSTSPSQDESEDDYYSEGDSHLNKGKPSKAQSTTARPPWKTPSSDEEETEDDISSNQNTKMPSKFKSSTNSEDDDEEKTSDNPFGYQQLMQTKAPFSYRPSWISNQKKQIYHH